MLDEPAAGLTHSEVDELGELIRSLRAEFDLTLLTYADRAMYAASAPGCLRVVQSAD